jgi:hypothetical protein
MTREPVSSDIDRQAREVQDAVNGCLRVLVDLPVAQKQVTIVDRASRRSTSTSATAVSTAVFRDRGCLEISGDRSWTVEGIVDVGLGSSDHQPSVARASLDRTGTPRVAPRQNLVPNSTGRRRQATLQSVGVSLARCSPREFVNRPKSYLKRAIFDHFVSARKPRDCWAHRGIVVRWRAGVEGSVSRVTRIVSLDFLETVSLSFGGLCSSG